MTFFTTQILKLLQWNLKSKIASHSEKYRYILMWNTILYMQREYFKMNNKIHKTVHRKNFDEVDFLLHNFKRDEKMMKRLCSFILSRFKNTLDFKEHAIKLLLLFRSTPVLCEKVRNWIAASTRPFASLWEKGCKRKKKRYRKCMSEKKSVRMVE